MTYYSFLIKHYNGHNNFNGMMVIISLYDNLWHDQYNIVIKGNQDLSLPEYRCDLWLDVMEPANMLKKELIWSTYHLSRGSKRLGKAVIE